MLLAESVGITLIATILFTIISSELLILLNLILLPSLVKESSLERFGWIKVAALGCVRLLILKHLLIYIVNDSHFVDVDLGFIFEVLEDSQYRQAITNLNILIDKPCPQIILPIASITPRVVEVVKPEHASRHTG